MRRLVVLALAGAVLVPGVRALAADTPSGVARIATGTFKSGVVIGASQWIGTLPIPGYTAGTVEYQMSTVFTEAGASPVPVTGPVAGSSITGAAVTGWCTGSATTAEIVVTCTASVHGGAQATFPVTVTVLSGVQEPQGPTGGGGASVGHYAVGG